MPPSSDSFSTWINGLTTWQGWRQLSPERRYQHAEEDYDSQYGVAEAEPGEGQGLCRLLEQQAVDTTGPALEIGCGSGFLTYGLAKHYPGPDFLVTDPSPTFLRITQTLLASGPGGTARPHYAVLNADDLASLPPEMFSVIALRSTLHHILDVPGFIAACARTLRPGGALVMGAEPCESGYLLMGVIGQAIAPVLEQAGVTILPAWRSQLDTLTETIKFYCRRGLDKTTAEDKHLFTPHELSDLGAPHGLQLRFFPNAAFIDFTGELLPNFESFAIFFLNYLRYCLSFDPELLQLIERHLQPQLKYIDDCYSGHAGPAITGVFLLKKNPA